MDHTACPNCPWVKSGFCNSVEECPNYVESWWTEAQTGQQKLVKDCAPKRLMLQMSALHNRLEGVQAATEELRNESHSMKGHFLALLDASQKYIDENDKVLIVEKKEKD